MTKNIFALSALALTLGFSACDTKIEPIEVVSPKAPINSELFREFKASAESRSAVLAMHYDWRARSINSLMNLPDSLDAVVLKNDWQEPYSEFYLKDIDDVRTIKHTRVFASVDLPSLVKSTERAIKADFRSKKNEFEASWDDAAHADDPDAKKKALADLEASVRKTHIASANESASKLITDALAAADKYMDGVSLEMPRDTAVFSIAACKALLAQITAAKATNPKLRYIVENPFSELSADFASATWAVYHNSADPKYSLLESTAKAWSAASFVPGIDISSKKDVDGFADSPFFDPNGAIPLTIDIINFKAPNKAGVAYYHTETKASEYEGVYNYPSLRKLINYNARKNSL